MKETLFSQVKNFYTYAAHENARDVFSLVQSQCTEKLHSSFLVSVSWYKQKVTKFFSNKAFVYALIIVPISSAGISTNVESPIENSLSSTPLSLTTASEVENIQTLKPVDFSDTSLRQDEEIVFSFGIENPAPAETNITILPEIPVEIDWSDDRSQVSIKPKTVWTPNTLYNVAVREGAINKPARIYHFRSHGLPQITDHSLQNEHKKVLVEENKSFDISFDREINDYDFQIVSRTDIDFAHETNADEKKLRVTFADVVEKRTEFDFIVYIKHKRESEKAFFPIDNIEFVGVPDQPTTWPQKTDDRMQLAIDKTLPKVTEGKYIDINVEARLTTLFEDGKAVKSYINSPGAEETPTITGEFRVENKLERPLSQSYGVYLPYWIAFTPDGKYGLHDLVEWPADHPEFPDSPEGGKESTNSIDLAVSAGCVRHDSTNSVEIYEWAEVGIPVIIY